MKHLLSTLLFLSFCYSSIAQNLILKINSASENESRIIDSLQYNTSHTTVASIEKEVLVTAKKLEKTGYLENYSSRIEKKNDSLFMVQFYLKNQTKYSYIYVGRNPDLQHLLGAQTNKDTIVLKYKETVPFLEEAIKKMEQKGYSLAKLQLINIKRKKDKLYAELDIKKNTQRKINTIVLKFKDEQKKDNFFPANYLHQINKKFKSKIFNQETLQKLKTEFDKYLFVRQSKAPELLFSKDSTQIYVYLEKSKANSFDGYIGFGDNKEKKTTLNGYLDVQLHNLLKGGEDFFVYWKSDGNNQKTFRTGITLNYLFKTPLGIKTQLHIFKQDSTFQNAKTFIDVHYLLQYNTKLFLGVESTVSSDIQNSNSSVSDYNNQFVTTGLYYTKDESNNPFFPEKTNIDLRIGTGKRTMPSGVTNSPSEKQLFVSLNVSHHLYFNPKNSISLRSQNFYLKSNTYLTNELFRFGGLYSIRGFGENSLQGSLVSALLSEYRHIVNSSLYFHSVLDYAVYKDNSSLTSSNKFNELTSIGIGIGLLTKNGLLKFSIANGQSNYNDLKIYNSIVNICYNVKF